jgi:hypothetical protein
MRGTCALLVGVKPANPAAASATDPLAGVGSANLG